MQKGRLIVTSWGGSSSGARSEPMTKFPGSIFTKAIGIPAGEGQSRGLSSEKSKLGSIQRRTPSLKQKVVKTRMSSTIVSLRFDRTARIFRAAANNASRRERL